VILGDISKRRWEKVDDPGQAERAERVTQRLEQLPRVGQARLAPSPREAPAE
jgi:hypothetical protein